MMIPASLPLSLPPSFLPSIQVLTQAGRQTALTCGGREATLSMAYKGCMNLKTTHSMFNKRQLGIIVKFYYMTIRDAS